MTGEPILRPDARPGLFWRLWAATAVTNLSDGIILVGFPLLAAELTRSPLLVSLIATIASLPWLLIALPAGALADRHDRRMIIIAAAWFRAGALSLFALLAVQGALDLWLLYALVLVMGFAEVFADTTTQSVLPMVVPRDRLAVANGRVIAAQRIANDFLGAPLGGVLVTLGAVVFFGFAAALYAVAALAVLTMRGTYRTARTTQATIRADISEAVVYLLRHRLLRTLALLAGTLNFSTFAYLAVFVLWAVGEDSAMQLDPALYGLLFAAAAGGGVVGALLAEHATRLVGGVRAMLGAGLVATVLMMVPLWLPTFEAVLPAFIVVGLGGALSNVLIVSMRQRLIPEGLLGRVNATYRLIGMGTMPIGALAGGATGSLLGLEAVFFMAVAVSLAGIAYASRHVSERSVKEAEDAAIAAE